MFIIKLVKTQCINTIFWMFLYEFRYYRIQFWLDIIIIVQVVKMATCQCNQNNNRQNISHHYRIKSNGFLILVFPIAGLNGSYFILF